MLIFTGKKSKHRKKVGNPEAPYTEADILKGETASDVRDFILSSIIKEVNVETDVIRLYAAESRKDQKQRPILWQSLERLISKFCCLKAVNEPSESINNYRSEEIDNLVFIINQIENCAIRNMWNPNNPESERHKLARTFFYRTAYNNWVNHLEEGLRFSYEQMKGSKFFGALCYQEPFAPDVRKRFADIIKRLFEHPLWVQETIQDEIAKTNQDIVVAEIFKREGLDYIYITKL